MIVAVGVDTVAIARIEALWREHGERFLARVFTPREREYCLAKARPAESLAARFAAKEAVLKCLRVGRAEGLAFLHVEVVRGSHGEVDVALHAAAAARARAMGVRDVHLSLTHTERDATAFAIAAG